MIDCWSRNLASSILTWTSMWSQIFSIRGFRSLRISSWKLAHWSHRSSQTMMITSRRHGRLGSSRRLETYNVSISFLSFPILVKWFDLIMLFTVIIRLPLIFIGVLIFIKVLRTFSFLLWISYGFFFLNVIQPFQVDLSKSTHSCPSITISFLSSFIWDLSPFILFLFLWVKLR